MGQEELKNYDALMEILRTRRSCRAFKPDPFPEEYLFKILESARWAMSGANSQPWEFVVVRDGGVRKALFDAYMSINTDLTFWMEQQRREELRHLRYRVKGEPHEALAYMQSMTMWKNAPAVIAVLGDGRKQWGTVVGGHTATLGQTHFSDALAMTCLLIHMSAASLGLAAQWVSIHLEEPFKRILDVPETHVLHSLIPVGYPMQPARAGVRQPIEDVVHYDRYDRNRLLSNEQIVERLRQIRQNNYTQYSKSGLPGLVK